MADEPRRERTVVVHTAGSSTEAMVIRNLLESNGIASPGSATDPFPMRNGPTGTESPEIVVLESQAEKARELIHDYLDDSEIQGIEGEDTTEK